KGVAAGRRCPCPCHFRRKSARKGSTLRPAPASGERPAWRASGQRSPTPGEAGGPLSRFHCSSPPEVASREPRLAGYREGIGNKLHFLRQFCAHRKRMRTPRLSSCPQVYYTATGPL